MFPDHDKFMQRVKQFDHKLRSYSRFFAHNSGFMDADDLYQEALLKLWERYCSEPDFLSNNNSYIWVYGTWMMKNAVNHERYVWVNKVSELENEKGDIPKLKTHFLRPENAAIREEVRDIARQMPDDYQQLYSAIAQGYATKEIAEMYSLSTFTINKRRNKMIQGLSDAWRVPPSEREPLIQDLR